MSCTSLLLPSLARPERTPVGHASHPTHVATYATGVLLARGACFRCHQAGETPEGGVDRTAVTTGLPALVVCVK
jgi:hypothetical protein